MRLTTAVTTTATMETEVSWQRKNTILSLPQRSLDLVRRYAEIAQQQQQEQLLCCLSDEATLQRVQKVAAKATNNGAGSAEYRCLETGGFLLPTVSHHPWYKEHKKLRSADSRSLLDLGSGMGADGRQMLVDGFATTVVSVDRSELYLRLGCELFGDDPTKIVIGQRGANIELEDPMPPAAFVAMDLVDQSMAEDTIVTTFQTILKKQQTNNKFYGSIPLALEFNAVYAGKFLHCLETEANLRILLRRVWKLMSHGGVFFGVFGRTYKPVFECANQKDFRRVLTEEGFSVETMLEELAGATWFCAHKGYQR